jgi:hypothetical protein
VIEVKFLGLIISTEGVRMDPAKLEAVVNWPSPQNVKYVQRFLGFANFYCQFISSFSAIAAPLSRLTRKDVKFQWLDEEKATFLWIMERFKGGSMLAHFDPAKPCIIETDASNYVTAAVLSRVDDQGILCPVAFQTRKMSPAECNYKTYDKELLAIIRAFKEWEPELLGTE